MSQASKTADELRILLRAQYPVIYLVTYEEKRAKKILRDLCQELQMEMRVWSFTEGVTVEGSHNPPQPANPLQILDSVRNADKHTMFVLRDLHSFFNSHEVIRKIRDLRNDQSDFYKPIVITSPILKIPPELEKVITVVDLDLPDREEISRLVDLALVSISRRRPEMGNMDDEQKDMIIKACTGLTTEEIENVLAKSWIENRCLDIPTILSEKKQIIRKGGILEYYNNLENYADVGGMDLLKQWLEDRTESFSDRARSFGLPQAKGILILGVPGTGKSLISKAIAGLWGIPLIKMDVGKIFAGIVGASEENIRRAISTVEAIAPCILFIDELEKSLSGTGSSNFSDAGTASRVFGTFLSWMQDKTSPVFVVATANDVRQLPPELLRKGRFDDTFFVDLPSKAERRDIFRIHITKPREKHLGRELNDSFDLNVLADATEGFSGAEIEQVVIAALFKAFKERKDLTQEHLLDAARETLPLSKTMRENIDYLKRWVHGRARYASSGTAESVALESIIPAVPKIRITKNKRREA